MQAATYFDRVLAYAKRVADRSEAAGLFERLACERFLRDLDQVDTDGFPYVLDMQLGSQLGSQLEENSKHRRAL